MNMGLGGKSATFHKNKPNMNEPTFDKSGYPTEETLREIELFPHERGPHEFLEFIKEAWNSDYGMITETPTMDYSIRVQLATGGWSGNGSIIQSMQANMFYPLYWQSSYRGGLHVFEIPLKS